GPQVFNFPGGGQGWANGNNFFVTPRPGVRAAPPTPNARGQYGQYRVYVLPPGGNQTVPAPRNAAPLKLVPPAAGQADDFVLTPPVVPQDDVIVPPPVAGNDLIIPPPLTPAPLVAPDENGDIELAPPLPLAPAIPDDAPKEKGQN
ncbi:MAG: hypothetical protein JOZ57_17710, partial [Abitibacteriaceae bacterium]|nr:hypothetical protein [Abditibacteriaceae bacterium]